MKPRSWARLVAIRNSSGPLPYPDDFRMSCTIMGAKAAGGILQLFSFLSNAPVRSGNRRIYCRFSWLRPISGLFLSLGNI